MKENQDTAFFTKGATYRCIKAVKNCFTVGKTYKQADDPTDWYGWLVNDNGDQHSWPQPSYVAHECMVWDSAPDKMDARKFFEKM